MLFSQELLNAQLAEQMTDRVSEQMSTSETETSARVFEDNDGDFLLRVRGCSVLLVEDSPEFRTYVTRTIRRSGGEIDCAENGLEGIKLALGYQYDVILMDLRMPKLDGFEATRKLREWGYDGSIVALTGAEKMPDRESCLAIGFDDFLTKPVHRARLLYTVAKRPRLPNSSRRVPYALH